MSSEPRSTSRARPRPITRGNRAMGPPPAMTPTPTSHCDKSFLSAREAHVAGERQLTAVSGRPPPDQRDRNERSAREAHQYVRPCLEAGGTLRDADQILDVREKVGVIQKDAVDGTFEDHHLHSVVVLERRDNLSDLPNELRTHEVERRVVEYHPNVRICNLIEADLHRVRSW